MRFKIEAEVVESLRNQSIKTDYINVACPFLSENIEAALRIGDLDLLKTELDWVVGLIKNHNLKTKELHIFLAAYIKAVQSVLDENGLAISKWLKNWLKI